MEKHLYKKKQCPKRLHDIELSDEVKLYVLANRIYHIPKQQLVSPVNSTINIYNQMTNIIASMDVIERIQTLVQKTQTDLIPLESKIEQLYGDTGALLTVEDGDAGGWQDNMLEKDDFYDIIERVSKTNDDTFGDIGMLFDDKLNKLHIREGDAWSLERFDYGVKRVIGMLQDTYFDHYECYLIGKILNDANFRARQQCEELLRLYYGFIESFDLKPFACSGNSSDDELLSDASNKERFERLFKIEKDALKKVQRDKYIREVRDIIVRNAQRNKAEISKRLLSLVKADRAFMQTILSSSHVTSTNHSL
jgi:hypothetical protein